MICIPIKDFEIWSLMMMSYVPIFLCYSPTMAPTWYVLLFPTLLVHILYALIFFVPSFDFFQLYMYLLYIIGTMMDGRNQVGVHQVGVLTSGRNQVGVHQVGVLTGGRNLQVGTVHRVGPLVVARQTKNGAMMDGTNLMTSGAVVVKGGTSQKRPSGVRIHGLLASLARAVVVGVMMTMGERPLRTSGVHHGTRGIRSIGAWVGMMMIHGGTVRKRLKRWKRRKFTFMLELGSFCIHLISY